MSFPVDEAVANLFPEALFFPQPNAGSNPAVGEFSVFPHRQESNLAEMREGTSFLRGSDERFFLPPNAGDSIAAEAHSWFPPQKDEKREQVPPFRVTTSNSYYETKWQCDTATSPLPDCRLQRNFGENQVIGWPATTLSAAPVHQDNLREPSKTATSDANFAQLVTLGQVHPHCTNTSGAIGVLESGHTASWSTPAVRNDTAGTDLTNPAASASTDAESFNVKSTSRTGRPWSKDEHERFLTALEQFRTEKTEKFKKNGKQTAGLGPGIADMIALVVKTRDAAQVRSHAQKYFQRQRRDRAKLAAEKGEPSKPSTPQ